MLHQRLEGHEAGRAAVFVDDQRFTDAAPLHGGEQIVGAQRLGDRERLARERAGRRSRVVLRRRFEQIGDVQHPDHVVEVVPVHRQEVVAAPPDLFDDRVARHVGGDGGELGPRHHHLAGREVGEVEHAVKHLLFPLLEDARLLAGGDEHLELLLGVDQRMPSGSFQAEQADDGAAGTVQQTDEGP